MAEEVVGIEHLKKAVKFGVDVAKQIEEAGKDGQFTWTDSFGFVDEISAVPGLIKSGKDILAELKDLSKEERVELNAYIEQEFDIANDKVESIVEDALSISFSIVSLVQKMK